MSYKKGIAKCIKSTEGVFCSQDDLKNLNYCTKYTKKNIPDNVDMYIVNNDLNENTSEFSELQIIDIKSQDKRKISELFNNSNVYDCRDKIKIGNKKVWTLKELNTLISTRTPPAPPLPTYKHKKTRYPSKITKKKFKESDILQKPYIPSKSKKEYRESPQLPARLSTTPITPTIPPRKSKPLPPIPQKYKKSPPLPSRLSDTPTTSSSPPLPSRKTKQYRELKKTVKYSTSKSPKRR